MLQYGIQPFWFWNGQMDESEMSRQILEMKEQGWKGFLIHPRQGLELPYLSDSFFQKVRYAVEEAKRRNMEVWLYDEFPYPSGVSAGEVTQNHEEYLATQLEYVTAETKAGETVRLHAPWGKVLMARAYPVKDGKCQWDNYLDLKDFIGTGYQQDVFQLSGLTAYSRKRYFQGDKSKYLYYSFPEGDSTWKIYVFVETICRNFKYFETFVDPLNPGAVQRFLETTHEKYKKYIGDEFGKTVKGIFSDEITAFPREQPWSILLPELIEKRHGLHILEYLPALFEEMGEITPRVRYAYWETAAWQFIESYDKQVLKWCEENDLLYIGEKPIMRSAELEFVGMPGIDAGHLKVGSKPSICRISYRGNGKIASSAAHFYDKPGTLCEALHSIGWGLTLQDMKWIFDWLTVGGVNWFITHGAYYTTDALKKHDAPPSSFYQMPWWRNMHQLSRYTDELIAFATKYQRRVNLLLLDPVTSTWTVDEKDRQLLEKAFSDFQERLLEESLDFYVIDPILFANGAIEEKEDSAVYHIGRDSYEVIVMPYMINLEKAAAEKIIQYVEAGGKLLLAGCVPYQEIEGAAKTDFFEKVLEADGAAVFQNFRVGNDGGEKRYENCLFVQKQNAAIEYLKREADIRWKIQPDAALQGQLRNIQSIDAEGHDRLFLCNLSGKSGEVSISLTGENSVRMAIAPYQSIFLDSACPEKWESEKTSEKTAFIALDGLWKQRIEGVNALRIGMWELTTEDGQCAIVDSFPVIDQYEQQGIKINVMTKPYFGCPKELLFGKTKAKYRFHFYNELQEGTPGEIYLVMEPGTMLGDWSLCLNGNVLREQDFVQKDIYLSTNLAVEVGALLVPGYNEILVSMETEVSYGGIRNPLYLCGAFGVFRKGECWSIASLPQMGMIKDMVHSGLPFFAGRVVYERTMEHIAKDVRQLEIRDEWLQDAVTLYINGKAAGSCAWSPYRFAVPQELLEEDPCLQLAVDTTLLGFFEGQYFDRKLHKCVGIEEVYDTPAQG